MLSLLPNGTRHAQLRVCPAAEDVRCLMPSFKFKYQRHKGGYLEKGLQCMQSLTRSPWPDWILQDFSFPNPVSGCFGNFSGIPLCWSSGALVLTCDPSQALCIYCWHWHQASRDGMDWDSPAPGTLKPSSPARQDCGQSCPTPSLTDEHHQPPDSPLV